MITTSRVHFRYGTQAGYLRSNIDQDTVYFLTDVGKIYKGNIDVTSNIVPVADEFPPASEAISQKLYIHVNSLEVRIKAGPAWLVLSPGYISDECDWADLSSDDKLVTKKVLKSKLADMLSDIIDGFSYEPETGTVHIGSSSVQLTGLVDDITYDRNRLQISIHEIGSDDRMVIDLPRDNYIQDFRFEDRWYFPDTGSIEPALVLVVRDGVSTTHEVAIPTKAFTDIYTGESTNTIEVSVSADNKISASVKVSEYSDSADDEASDSDLPKLLFMDKSGNIIARSDRSWKAIGGAISLAVAQAQGLLQQEIDGLAQDINNLQEAINSMADTILGSGDALMLVVSTESGGVTRSDISVEDVKASICWTDIS